MDPSAEHSPESYRALFGLIGGAMLVLVLVFILASALIAPLWAPALLVGLWLVAAIGSGRTWRKQPWVPLLAGTVMAVVWITVITFGSAMFGWRT